MHIFGGLAHTPKMRYLGQGMHLLSLIKGTAPIQQHARWGLFFPLISQPRHGDVRSYKALKLSREAEGQPRAIGLVQGQFKGWGSELCILVGSARTWK